METEHVEFKTANFFLLRVQRTPMKEGPLSVTHKECPKGVGKRIPIIHYIRYS